MHEHWHRHGPYPPTEPKTTSTVDNNAFGPFSAVPRLCLAHSLHYDFYFFSLGSRRTALAPDAGMHRIAFARARIRLSRVGRGATDTAGRIAFKISADVSNLTHSFRLDS